MEAITLQELLTAVDGKLLTDADLSATITCVDYDSRTVTPGSLFLPLVGETHDAHSFISNALDAGAAGCLTARERERYLPGKFYIKVANTNRALRALSAHYKSKFPIPFVAITGSVGKTTTKEMIGAVLEEKFRVHKTTGNHNNDIGVPQALLELDSSHQISVIEMGMNSFGEIDNLGDLVHPQMAIITNIGDSHIENLGSRDGILTAKCEVFPHMAPTAPAVLNGDDALLLTLASTLNRPILYCGNDPALPYHVSHLDKDLVTGDLRCTVTTPTTQFEASIPALGNHMIYPVLMAAAVGEYFGMTGAEIARGIRRYAPAKMRMHLIDRGQGVCILDDAYNASPQSMRAGIQVLGDSGADYKIAVLGDMFELGAMAPSLHAAVGTCLGGAGVQCLVAIGPLAKEIATAAATAQVPEVYWFETKEEARTKLAKLVRPNCTILVKASRGMFFEELVDYLVSITPEKD